MIYTAFNGFIKERERESEIIKDDLETENKPSRS